MNKPMENWRDNPTKYNIPRKPRKTAEPAVTVGPAATYTEYVPDARMRQAMARAARDQPEMITLDSTVPIDYSARLDRRPLESK